QAKAGLAKDAAATLDQLLRLMESTNVFFDESLSKALHAIAEATDAGRTPEVSAMANHALQLVQSVSAEQPRKVDKVHEQYHSLFVDWSCFGIVAAIARLEAKAGKIAEALQLAQSINADAPVLVSIAEAQARAGLKREATTTFDKALKLAQAIQ